MGHCGGAPSGPIARRGNLFSGVDSFGPRFSQCALDLGPLPRESGLVARSFVLPGLVQIERSLAVKASAHVAPDGAQGPARTRKTAVLHKAHGNEPSRYRSRVVGPGPAEPHRIPCP